PLHTLPPPAHGLTTPVKTPAPMRPRNVSVLALMRSTALFVRSAKKYLPVEFSTQLMSKLVGSFGVIVMDGSRWNRSLPAAKPTVTASSSDTRTGVANLNVAGRTTNHSSGTLFGVNDQEVRCMWREETMSSLLSHHVAMRPPPSALSSRRARRTG